MLAGDMEDQAAQAETILSSMAGGAFCVAQEWDGRIDCMVKLPNGELIGEMISLEGLSEDTVRQTGERLAQRLQGLDVPLMNPIQPPRRIVPS